MEKNIARVLVSEQEIQSRVAELAAQISKDYEGKNPLFVGVLNGVVVFYSDIIRRITVPCQMDFMWLSSYGGTESTGKVQVKRDVSQDISGRHIVILEDIFDTGNSLDFTYRHLMSKNPASVRVCTLLDKPERRNPAVTVQPDYVGFTIPNEFVVGYGLDFDYKYRQYPFVGVLKNEYYE